MFSASSNKRNRLAVFAATLLTLGTCALVTSLCVVSDAQAQTTAVSTIGDQSFTNGGFSLGFQFAVVSQIDVTALGFFDIGQDGLGTTHDVGIFRDLDQSLVAFAQVGPSAILDGKWAYTSITPVTLNAGENYRIAAVADSGNIDGYVADATSFFTAPEITFIGERFAGGTTLVFPTQDQGGTNGYFTPNFKFGAVAVPEGGH